MTYYMGSQQVLLLFLLLGSCWNLPSNFLLNLPMCMNMAILHLMSHNHINSKSTPIIIY